MSEHPKEIMISLKDVYLFRNKGLNLIEGLVETLSTAKKYKLPLTILLKINNTWPNPTYSDGLTGGIGRNSKSEVQQGGFGGGGSYYRRAGSRSIYYHGAGGGYTGGSTIVYNEHYCYGGGGGSYSADPNATFDHQYVEFGECTIRRLWRSLYC